MTEINGNLPNFGLNIGKVEPKKEKETLKQQNIDNEQQQTYIQDTGVLGRSQVVRTRGGDITRSVDEAVNLAKNHPELLDGGDVVFESVYNTFVNQGMDEADAYLNALSAQTEFMDIAVQRYQ